MRTKISGYLSSIKVDIGDQVKRDQLIAKIEVPELRDELREAEAAWKAAHDDLAKAKAERLRQAKAAWKAAQDDLAKAKAELREAQPHAKQQKECYTCPCASREKVADGQSRQAVDEARADYWRSRAAVKAIERRMDCLKSEVRRAKATMQRLRMRIANANISAPLDGVVTKRFVDPGALLQAATSSKNGQPIVTIASLDRVRILIHVPESKVPFVQAGTSAVLRVDAMPSRKFPGEVTRFAWALDPATRTMRTEVELENSDWLLRPGMHGQVALSFKSSPDAITVPVKALREDGDGSFVYRIVNDSFAKRVGVEAVIWDGGKAEVTSGLKGDEEVVKWDSGGIADGIPVKIVGSRR